MDLDHILVGDYYHTVPQGFQIALEAVLLFFPIFFFYINDKLRTVAELNVGLLHRCLPKGCLWLLGWFDRRIIDLLPKKRIIRTS